MFGDSHSIVIISYFSLSVSPQHSRLVASFVERLQHLQPRVTRGRREHPGLSYSKYLMHLTVSPLNKKDIKTLRYIITTATSKIAVKYLIRFHTVQSFRPLLVSSTHFIYLWDPYSSIV